MSQSKHRASVRRPVEPTSARCTREVPCPACSPDSYVSIARHKAPPELVRRAIERERGLRS